MIKVQIVRPNTVGTTFSKEFDTFKDSEDWIELHCEKYADKGWQACELRGSNSNQGTIELTNDSEADLLLIEWNTIN